MASTGGTSSASTGSGTSIAAGGAKLGNGSLASSSVPITVRGF